VDYLKAMLVDLDINVDDLTGGKTNGNK